MQHRSFDGPGIGATTGVALHSERMGLPLRWRKPRRIFVCSLADLFHADVPDRFLAETFSVMARCPQHVFQVLTKRPARMRALLASSTFATDVRERALNAVVKPVAPMPWPLSNVWCGVSVETQQWADARIPILLDTPAAVRWISAEPLLGPVDLAGFLPRTADASWYPVDCRHGHGGCPVCDRVLARDDALSWVVVGGESGPGARPAHPDWFRSLRDQCTSAGVPFHHKQNGEHAPVCDKPRHGDLWVPPTPYQTALWEPDDYRARSNLSVTNEWRGAGGTALVRRVGKKAAGRELDGQIWDEYPVGAP